MSTLETIKYKQQALPCKLMGSWQVQAIAILSNDFNCSLERAREAFESCNGDISEARIVLSIDEAETAINSSNSFNNDIWF